MTCKQSHPALSLAMLEDSLASTRKRRDVASSKRTQAATLSLERCR